MPYSVVQREVDKLERSDLVRSTRFATSRRVRANETHPLYRELRALPLKAYGPRQVLAELLADEAGVQQAYIYGSWAARYSGEWGEAPADLDVLIVGDVSSARRAELEAEAEDGLGQPVHVEVVEPDEWQGATSAFLRTVKQRPLVAIGSADA
ncbi:MAG TPA: nucleotidyltransferase domain-containing protein [Gaiellaceae bacterium]|nr:nucleotidyltransferase domain-containing protein [Gaiellaceae bacterium]